MAMREIGPQVNSRARNTVITQQSVASELSSKQPRRRSTDAAPEPTFSGLLPVLAGLVLIIAAVFGAWWLL